MATICCSPPLMVRAICPCRSCNRGNKANTCASVCSACALARRAKAPSSKFSRTDNSPKMPRPSGTKATPASTTRCAGIPIMPTPPMLTLPPACGATMPPRALSRVDLPAPLAPKITTTSDAASVKDAASTALCLPNDTLSCETSSSGAWSRASGLCTISLPQVRGDHGRMLQCLIGCTLRD